MARYRSRILIVGAGAAGVAAADKLWSKGFMDLLVLEAQGRTGGRIFSHTSDCGDFIELGPQWIHGEDHDIFRKAKEADLILEKRTDSLLDEDEATGDFVLDSGRPLTEAEKDTVEDVLDHMNSVLRDFDEESNFSEKQLYNLDFAAIFHEKFKEYTCKFQDQEGNRLRRAVFDWLTRYQFVDNSCPDLKHLSIRAFTGYELDGDVTVRLKCTLSAFLEHLTKGFPRSNILLNKIVSKITFDKKRAGFPVEVQCEDGSVFPADHVIFTGSLGVLKASPDLFVPKLSEEKRDAIRYFGFGTICKIILEFPYPFWEDLGNGWKTDGFQPLWVEKFAEIKPEDDVPWYRWALGFDIIRTKKNTLVLWVAGPVASVVDLLPDDEISSGAVDCLKLFTGNVTIPDPVKLFREKWSSNRFTLGTYSYFSVEASTRGIDSSDLAEPEWPLCEDCGSETFALMFAGEATYPEFYSTIHGAILSGRREADRIFEWYNEDNFRRHSDPVDVIPLPSN